MSELIAHGLTPHQRRSFGDVLGEGESLGRVVRQDRGFVNVVTETSTAMFAVIGRHIGPVVVGDWVGVDSERVTRVFERSSALVRRDVHNDVEQILVANIDIVLIVCGSDRTRRIGRIERAITQSLEANASPLVVLTKTDLLEDVERELDVLRDAVPNAGVIGVSSFRDEGLVELRRHISQKTSAMFGESGAGKSTLLNALLNEDVSATGEVRGRDNQGRHTTTRREMYLLPGGGVIIDTPGVRALGVWAATEAVDETFDEVAEAAQGCRFADCHHRTEPGCAIAEGLENGSLAPERVESWKGLRIEAEASQARRELDEKRRNARGSHGRRKRR